MRRFLLPLSLAVFVVTPVVCTAAPQTRALPGNVVAPPTPSQAPTLSLDQAWQFAERANPQLRQALAQRAAIEGDTKDAQALLWNNPRLYGEAVRRDVPQVSSSERQRKGAIGIEKTFEIAGQQGYCRQGSQQQLQAVDFSIEETRREVRVEVEKRFVQVLSLQHRIDTERLSLQIIEDTAASVRKRVTAGKDSRLDGNLATVEAVRARNQIGVLEEQLLQARGDLAWTLQVPVGDMPIAGGSLATPPLSYTLEQLLARAAQRPSVRALDYREQAAQSRLSLERASRYPDLTVGLAVGREGPGAAREKLTGITVSLPLPLFRQNAGGVGRALTELEQARNERQSGARNTEGTIVTLWQTL